MNNSQKNILFASGTVFLIILSIFFIVNTMKTLDTAATTNTISFTGEGKVSVKPDIAKVNFAIVTQALTSKEAQNANSPKSKAVTDFLKRQGVEEKDIKTSAYNISPQYNYPRSGTPEIKGYQVSQSFEVKIRNLDKTNTILDGLVSAGANNINNLGFSTDNPDKIQAEARAKAIADAKQKAHDLEKQLGVSLGKIVNFSENTGGYPYPVPMYAKDMDGMGGGVVPEIPTGENEIKVNITITYQIK